MERSRISGLKTYGRKDRQKSECKKRSSIEKGNRSPLMSWNDLVNKSDSFDRLARSSIIKICKEDNLNTDRMASDDCGYADENRKRPKKKRLGLSLRKKCNQKKTSPNRQSVDFSRSPAVKSPVPQIYRYKPYPALSPIEPPTNSDEIPKMLQKCKMYDDNLIKIKEPEKELIKNSESAKEPPDEDFVIPPEDLLGAKIATVSQLALPANKFEAHVDFEATSTPNRQGTDLSLTFPRTHFDKKSNVPLPPRNDTKNLHSIRFSLNVENDFSSMQPYVRLMRPSPKKFNGFNKTYLTPTGVVPMVDDDDDDDDDDDLTSNGYSKGIEGAMENLVTEMARLKPLGSVDSSKTIRSSFRKASSESSMFKSYHQTIKNESEETTVPLETTPSLSSLYLKSSAVQNSSVLQQSLMFLCSQPEILEFEACFPKRQIKKCLKVGEGTYGEVFAVTVNSESLILKVVPFEGDFEINGATQKKFQDIQNEAVVSRELSDLRIGGKCSTFIRLFKTYCIKGEYPKGLLRAWQRYHREVGSENESPKVFDANQLYMVFVYENGGCDLEKHKFSSAAQTKSAFLQLCCALAIAENTLQFEHRDLHWGNVLISKTKSPIISFVLPKHEPVKIKSEGISVQIIDYSICRMQKAGVKTIYTDLSDDDALFTGQGDHQFEVYRMMKALNNNNWKEYNPKTNVFWLGYILGKLCSKAECIRNNRVKCKIAVKQLQEFQKLLPMYNSTQEFVVEWKNKWDSAGN